MKLADHIQHNQSPDQTNVIGGGGFAFYQTRLTTANPIKVGPGSYFMGKPMNSNGPQSPHSRQGKRYVQQQQQHNSQSSRQPLTSAQQQQAILMSQTANTGFSNTVQNGVPLSNNVSLL